VEIKLAKGSPNLGIFQVNPLYRDSSKMMNQHREEDALRGQAVKNQKVLTLHLGIVVCYIYLILSKFLPLFDLCPLKAIWDKTLEMRFLLQKAFSTSNKLPQVVASISLGSS
jgi:hypothetical protein